MGTSTGAGRVKAIVIGTGFIGTVHCEAVRRVGAELLGVLGSSPERGREAALRIGTTAYESLAAVLDSEADVVHVTTPNVLHAEQAEALLRAGKHVICEKPLTTELADARALAALAAETGLVNAVCFNFRFYPLLHEARARVARGDLGPVHLINGHYLQDWLLRQDDWNWRLDSEVGGATRAVADIGSHWLDAAQFVAGADITEVLADLQTVHKTRLRPVGEVETFTVTQGERHEVEVRTDDAANILLRFASGAHGVLSVSQVSAGHKNDVSLEFAGVEGALRWDSTDPDHLWLGMRGAPNETVSRDPGAMAAAAAAVSQYPAGHVEGFGDAFRGLVSQVYRDVAAGGPAAEPAYPTFADGLRAMAIDDAIRRSAADQTWTSVENSVERNDR